MTQFKKQQKVKVFQDPMTCQNYEGIAILKSFIDSSNDSETWMVRFNPDEGKVRRIINLNNY